MFLLIRKPLAGHEKVAKTNHSSTLPSPPRGPTDHGDEQARLDVLRKPGEDPRLLKSESKRELIKQATNPSLIKAAVCCLERSKNKPSTVKG